MITLRQTKDLSKRVWKMQVSGLAVLTRVRKTGFMRKTSEKQAFRKTKFFGLSVRPSPTASSLAASVAAASATSGRPVAVHHTATRAALLPSPAPPTLVAAASIAITVAPTTGGVASLVAVPLLLPSCCSPRLPRCRLCRQRRAAIAVAFASCPPPLSHPLRCHLLQLASLLRAASPFLSALSLPLVCSCIQFTCQHLLLLRSSLPHWVSHVCCATACALYKCESKCAACCSCELVLALASCDS